MCIFVYSFICVCAHVFVFSTRFLCIHLYVEASLCMLLSQTVAREARSDSLVSRDAPYQEPSVSGCRNIKSNDSVPATVAWAFGLGAAFVQTGGSCMHFCECESIPLSISLSICRYVHLHFYIYTHIHTYVYMAWRVGFGVLEQASRILCSPTIIEHRNACRP